MYLRTATECETKRLRTNSVENPSHVLLSCCCSSYSCIHHERGACAACTFILSLEYSRRSTRGGKQQKQKKDKSKKSKKKERKKEMADRLKTLKKKCNKIIHRVPCSPEHHFKHPLAFLGSSSSDIPGHRIASLKSLGHRRLLLSRRHRSSLHAAR